MSMARSLLPLWLTLALSACANLPLHPAAAAHDPETLARALSGELILQRAWEAEDLPDHDLFLVTPEMQAFALQAVSKMKRDFGRAEALQRALLLPVNKGGLGIVYDSLLTETPIDAFVQRRVNCVSFTLMYVALARHVGLDAYVNEVDLPPSWDLRNKDAFLFLRHVNVKVKLPRKEEVVIDLEMDRYSPAYSQRYISEELAAAQFYNNRGMELAATGDAKTGFLYLRKALLLDDRQSYIWSNFATLYRRQGLYAEAESAYLHGLSLDADDLTIMSNLAGLYRLMGDKLQADYYSARAERHRDSNPYYRFSQAGFELEEGRAERALILVRQAIHQRDDEPRFYQLAAEIHEQLGDAAAAARMRAKMLRLQQPFIQRN